MNGVPTSQNIIEIIHDTNIIKQGSFFKRGNHIQTWHRRFFILYENGMLEYFTKECGADQAKFKKGSMNLTYLKSIDDSDVIFKRRFSKQQVAVGYVH